MSRALPRTFFARECLVVAEGLLGQRLCRRMDDGSVRAGRIVEVEAYVHEEDLACHARFGRTPRALRLYGPPGHAYVFLIYGMYDCFNVVTESVDSPAAVLVRALEPEAGVAECNGPGKLCRSLAITRALDGADLCSKNAQLWIAPGPAPRNIAATPRIGIDYAGEWAFKPWRFIDADSRAVSKARPPRKSTVAKTASTTKKRGAR